MAKAKLDFSTICAAFQRVMRVGMTDPMRAWLGKVPFIGIALNSRTGSHRREQPVKYLSEPIWRKRIARTEVREEGRVSRTNGRIPWQTASAKTCNYQLHDGTGHRDGPRRVAFARYSKLPAFICRVPPCLTS